MLLATVVMTVMFQILVRRLTQLEWSDMLGPQVPAAICSIGLIGVLVLTRGAIRMFLPQAHATVIMGGCLSTAAIYYAVFVLLAPFSEVRALIHETAVDFAPGLARRLTWLAPREEDVPALSAP